MLIILLTGISSFSQTINTRESAGPYISGYQNIITTDSTRIYKHGTSTNEKFHYRPIEIDVWFPATGAHSKSPMRYGEFLNLLEQRSNRFQDDTVYKNLSSDLVQYICANLNIRDTSAMTNYKTASWLNAEPVKQHFPLIIYMSAFNGMSFENIKLFENLSSHGYIIACITSVGTYPGNMSMKIPDLMEQVGDGAFALQLLKSKNNADSNQIGAIGYSWGGLSAWILSQKQKDIKAVISWDGSEMHHYGETADEDNDFDSIRRSFFFDSTKSPFKYVHLASGFKQDDPQADSVFNIFLYTGYPKQYVSFPKAKHEDFSCLPFVAADIAQSKNGSAEQYRLFNQLTLNFFNQYLKNDEKSFSRQLTQIYATHSGDSLLPEIHSGRGNAFLIRGKIIEEGSNNGLAYVNIGIPNKNRGTVSNRDGGFEIKVDTLAMMDSLKVSMVGYKSRSYLISELLKKPKPLNLALQRQETELQEVFVSRKKLEVRTLGNTTTSTFVSVGLPLKFLGSEIGVRINLGKKLVLIKNFVFNISDSRIDTAVFRLNIYHFKNGIPQENILQKNILISVGKRKGKYIIPLGDYKLLLKDDILISLEWIEGSVSGAGNGVIFLSAAFLNSPTWHRLTSQDKWKKATGFGVGFNVEVQQF